MVDAHQNLLDRIGEALGLPRDAFNRFDHTLDTVGEQAEALLTLFASIADPEHRRLVIDFARRIAKSDGRSDTFAGA